jgi:hypothetical protein
VNGVNYVLDANLRLHKVAIGAEAFATHALIVAGERGHHDNFYLASFWRGAQNV